MLRSVERPSSDAFERTIWCATPKLTGRDEPGKARRSSAPTLPLAPSRRGSGAISGSCGVLRRGSAEPENPRLGPSGAYNLFLRFVDKAYPGLVTLSHRVAVQAWASLSSVRVREKEGEDRASAGCLLLLSHNRSILQPLNLLALPKILLL